MLQNASVLYILTWKCASRHSGVQFSQIETSKMAPSMRCFVHFDLQMCFAPQRRAIFRHLSVKKWPEPASFLAFWRTNVLRATAACHFSGSQLAKWLREWGVLYILTYKCASRHSGVPFFRIATCKMAPPLKCFVHFDLQMCFAPQRRAIFHNSSRRLPPHPPLLRGYFSNSRQHESLKKHSDSRLY